MARIRFAARDPGGANVLAPLIERLSTAHPVDVWALPVAAAAFERHGRACRQFIDPPDEALLADAWAADPAGFLVTGTSGYAPFEAALWNIARLRDTPTLAVIDAWFNTRARFRYGRPDFVTALDGGHQEELQALGFPGDRIVLAGHSWLDHFRSERSRVLKSGAAESRTAPVQVLFVSEGFAQDVAKGVNAVSGFDEIDSFHLLWRAAAEAASEARRVEIAVKFHPYEDPGRFLAVLAELPARPHLRIRPLPLSTRPHPWVLWADLVTGISSVLLLESIILDRPVVSLQPGLTGENTFIASVRGYATTLTVADDTAALVTLMQDQRERDLTLARNRRFLDSLPNQTDRIICDWIDQKLRIN